MKIIKVENTLVSNKRQAIQVLKRLNKYFTEDKSYEMAIVIDDYTERLVNAGFITWEEAEVIGF
mgnify:FL=1